MKLSVLPTVFIVLSALSALCLSDDTCVGGKCPAKLRPVDNLKVCGFIHKNEDHAHCFTAKCDTCFNCPEQLTCQNFEECEFVAGCEEIPATTTNRPKPQTYYCAVPSSKINVFAKSFIHCHSNFECNPKKKNGGCNPDFDCIPSDKCDFFIPCGPYENPFFEGEDEH